LYLDKDENPLDFGSYTEITGNLLKIEGSNSGLFETLHPMAVVGYIEGSSGPRGKMDYSFNVYFRADCKVLDVAWDSNQLSAIE
jgi:hypothetical protein